MQLTFSSIEEVREFIKSLKGTRGGKGGADDGENVNPTAGSAPPPLQPPSGGAAGQAQPQFNPGTGQAQPFAPQFQPPGQGAGFPGASAVDPALQAIVGRIVAKIDGALTNGQPADAVLKWFREQCGAEAANATLDQIKQMFLAKLPMASLENIAKLMGA